ncbi:MULTISPECIES: hypothetical protein [Parachlamydia]|jgi:hypothetical protein|uniref:Uncharacterized protein n=1 Tax=Parachlamydia acanthamoebae TaxID=83552 RepID=A0A0C1C4U5_9BACT|nr:hypothetical protein [Parachlamydia acanthamoebae]KIA76215.1 hypothetical protein DB43_AQ00210 [Parachlamydia acanthamoebae]
MLSIRNINHGCTQVEKFLNVAECVPIVGMLSSALRVKAAYGQVVFGLGCAAVGGVGLLISALADDEKGQKTFKKVTMFGAEHMIHGALNALRGFGVLLLGTCTFGLGNVQMIVPNMWKEDHFAPFFQYGKYTEEQSKANLPY